MNIGKRKKTKEDKSKKSTVSFSRFFRMNELQLQTLSPFRKVRKHVIASHEAI